MSDDHTQKIMSLANRLADVLHGEEYGVTIHTLVYLLAYSLTDVTASKEEAIAQVAKDIGDWYDTINSNNTIQ